MEQLNTLPDTEKNKALYPLQQCKKRITTAHTLFQLISEAQQATELEDEAIEVINDYIDAQAKEREKTNSSKKVADDTLFPDKPTETTKDEPEVKPYVAPPKKIVIISPSELLTKDIGVQYIETREDIENYLDTLRQQLMKAVDNNEKIRIK